MIENNPEKMVDFLNRLVRTDAEAVSKLMEIRVDCNEDLADHPTVQVLAPEGKPPKVGLLGMLNGYFGTFEDGPKQGWGPISMVVDDKDMRTVQRFELTKNE